MPQHNEQHRLATLNLYRILDTATEQAFEDLTKLAQVVCGTPISLVSFVDAERQWFKSRRGLGVSETPREHAFCSHAISDTEIMIVEDTHKDVRFKDNPLVTDDPNIRFYAGAPLRVPNGSNLGTLCVIDRTPRKLTQDQLKALEVLRDAVVTQLELRRAAQDLQALQSMLPMCAWCRRIRQDKGADETWTPLHEFVAATTEVSHGICPDCETNVLAGDL